jgi:hypothetical protein
LLVGPEGSGLGLVGAPTVQAVASRAALSEAAINRFHRRDRLARSAARPNEHLRVARITAGLGPN